MAAQTPTAVLTTPQEEPPAIETLMAWTRLPDSTTLRERRTIVAQHLQRSRLAILQLEEAGALSPRTLLMAKGQHGAKQKEWGAELAVIDAQLRDIERRDAFAADRPAGCFCLGLGGRGRSQILFGQRLWAEWCECPEALRAREDAAAAIARANEEEAARLSEHRHATEAEDLRRRLAMANIPPLFAELDFSTFPRDAAKAEAIERLAAVTGETVGARGAFLWGDCGTGKTGLAVSALKQRIVGGGWGMFVTVPELLDWLRPQGERGALRRPDVALERVSSTPLLVLDDLGAERITDWARERLFLVVNHRHDHILPTVFTSNFSLAETARRLAGSQGPTAGNRIAWRIKEACEVIELQGRNLRDAAGAA